MRRGLITTIALMALLAGCSSLRDSRFNPANWFRKSTETAVAPALPQDSDKRALAERILDLRIEPYPGGALVRATALPPTQGWWDAELKARPIDEDGTLVLEFRLFPPLGAAPVVNQPSREIVAAYALSDIRLARISRITVQGQANALTSGR